MRVLFAPRGLHVGGANDVFILMAAEMRRRGHEVFVFSHPGVWERRCAELGLDTEVVAYRGSRPWSATVRDLLRVSRRFRPDVIWAATWSSGLVALWGPHLCDGVPLVIASYASEERRRFPSSVGLTFGRPAAASSYRHGAGVWTVPPPVDTSADRPGSGGGEFRRSFGIDPAVPLVVTVSRLVRYEKLDGLRAAIDAVTGFRGDRSLHLAVVGEGPERRKLQGRALAAETTSGGRSVTFCGELADVRPAFDAADVVVGRGLGVMRAMAHAKPVVVLDARGGGCIVEKANLSWFLENGFIVCPPGTASRDLGGLVRALVEDSTRAASLGTWSRDAILEHRSVSSSGDALEDALQEMARSEVSALARASSAVATAAQLTRTRLVEG